MWTVLYAVCFYNTCHLYNAKKTLISKVETKNVGEYYRLLIAYGEHTVGRLRFVGVCRGGLR